MEVSKLKSCSSSENYENWPERIIMFNSSKTIFIVIGQFIWFKIFDWNWKQNFHLKKMPISKGKF